MGVSEWIISQSISVKLTLGLGVGLLIWILFRWFIYIANKTWEDGNPRKANLKDRLETLSGR